MSYHNLQVKGDLQMPRRVDVTFELPDEVAPNLRDEDLAVKAKEAFTMELLREHEISQGKAAELLGIDRHELFDLMTKYRVPVIDLTPEELAKEMKTPFPRAKETNA
jgi:predicted HTH domain antitoxin